MSIARFLAPALSPDHLQAQLRDQELGFGMEILAIGLFQTADEPPLRNNFVRLTSHVSSNLPELQKEVAADDAKFASLFNSLGAGVSIVDSAMVLIDDVVQQIVLFRNGVSSSSATVPQTPSGSMPLLPDYAQNILSPESGVPWSKCERLSGMDNYAGMVPDSSRLFRELTGPDGGPMNVVYYECKLITMAAAETRLTIRFTRATRACMTLKEQPLMPIKFRLPFSRWIGRRAVSNAQV
jgi:hypothetical protein